MTHNIVFPIDFVMDVVNERVMLINGVSKHRLMIILSSSFTESLRFTSAISVLLAVVFVAISSVMAISALFEGKTQSPRLLPQVDDRTSFFDLFTAVPVIVTAFTFHFNGKNPSLCFLGKKKKI